MLTSKKVNCISSSHDHAGPSILCMQVLWITQKICFKESKRLRIRSQGEKKKKDKRGKKKKDKRKISFLQGGTCATKARSPIQPQYL